MIFDGDVVIREVQLPPGVHGMIHEDPDGIANIYISESDSEEEKQKTLAHELRHLALRHLGSGRPVRMMEEETNCEEGA